MITSVTFSDIVSQRNSSSTDLTTKFVLFKIREFPRSGVHSFSEFSSFFINVEVLKCPKCSVLLFWHSFQLFNLSTLLTSLASSILLNDQFEIVRHFRQRFQANLH